MAIKSAPWHGHELLRATITNQAGIPQQVKHHALPNFTDQAASSRLIDARELAIGSPHPPAGQVAQSPSIVIWISMEISRRRWHGGFDGSPQRDFQAISAIRAVAEAAMKHNDQPMLGWGRSRRSQSDVLDVS
ncbi:MAG: hypothetical protein A3F84_19940 [Candidatus Handelsmanbacteria bacterium RIFCSPLOWO2_12_FULL_64_10]|uniref:Uncharacterized protein n=1 Tax=Handelsmanbacteria sp. (strain RIFCSPLOWO2_12_FULL_64_10) TaxID=1817868 RepID=A0A1F6D266_HANXR|nr:MAG: hypothetical protein A3F84_19940 [Candidatus Handelsmanbacteria bacterium RIFCSPLOWO2_12_FULL_64_10]